jgi:UDPglucose--hexose-1-phosphate uridylyltransferase
LEEIQNVLRMYKQRYNDLSGDSRFKYVLIFKNFGESSGASIEHGHSQLIALPMIPKYVQEKMEGAGYYFNHHKRSVFADILEQEKQEKQRIVFENEKFICFCPFVQRFPFEMWIFPKNMDSKFQQIEGAELTQLAEMLKDSLSRLKNCLANPSYNFYLQLDPINIEYEKSFLWHIEIVPKLTRASELDWDTGFYVVHTPPEQAARYLREAK